MLGRRRTTTSRPAIAPDWRAFDEVAEEYARIRAPLHRPAAADLVAALGPPAEGGLLDLGTGTGVLLAEARKAGWRPAVGVDRSVPMLAQARASGPAAVAAADAVDLPFRDATFGAVAGAFVIHTFSRYETALFDLVRVLRSGGRAGFATWGSTDDEFSRTWRSIAETYSTRELLADAVRRAAPWRERFSDPGRLDEALRGAGLRSVRVERRQYRASLSIEVYLASQEITAEGRFLRGMLPETMWARFRDQVRETFRSRFAEPLGDTYEVLLSIGSKE
ncbi:MAG TPA: methyltransferase domain-containing protein [Actinomycetota bacterium]|nr:methyltransferase domain-containing protein [Actinomycetota bacterium]